MNTVNTQHIKPRRALLALLASALLPGLGQLYNGHLNKGCWFLLAFGFFSVPAFVLVTLYLPEDWVVPGLLASVLMMGVLWIYSMLEASLEASRQRDYVPADWQGGGVYLLVFVLCALLALPLMTRYVRQNLVEAYRIPSGSMEPTVVAGDFIIADKRYNCPGCKQQVQRGDVVVFTYPNNRNINYIKRVIGLPGDRVELRDHVIRVNGQPLTTTSQQQEGMDVVQESDGEHSWLVIWKEAEASTNPRAQQHKVTVPVGEVFVLGDNRNSSNDSRFFGTVPLEDIRGKARQIWLSYNGKLGGLQLDRSGRVIR
ncbi:MAG: signal peptidase I [Thiolinea sp.]